MIDSKEIMESIRANSALLESCKRHDFSIPIDRNTKKPIPEKVLFCDWRCSNCGGWVDGQRKVWYNLGLKHGELEASGAV